MLALQYKFKKNSDYTVYIWLNIACCNQQGAYFRDVGSVSTKHFEQKFKI